MNYESIKLLHVGCAAVVAVILMFRLLLAAYGIDYRSLGPLRWIPHLVDTILLMAAGWLLWSSERHPYSEPWLTAKIVAIPLYVIAAAIALNPGQPTHARLAASAISCLLLIYIFAVAITRTPIPLMN